MKKVNTSVAEKKVEQKNAKKDRWIKFNLSPGTLACFKGQPPPISINSNMHTKKEIKTLSQVKNEPKSTLGTCLPIRDVCKNQRLRSITCLKKGTFDERVVFMEYGNFDVYVDNSTKKKSNSSKSRSPSQKKIKHENEHDGSEDEFVSSCVRVITEETDNTSEPYSLSNTLLFDQNLHHKSEQMMNYYGMMECYPSRQQMVIRNRRSITLEESKAFVIDFDKIQFDGRTTIMVKNIPNKYTQETLLEEFSVNHDKTFDFFYLPIDKDNQCNVGYAFVNFVNTASIKTFYKQFHGKKWKKYNSAKICHLCYARYQGTLQLANHFRHTKILHQKDKKLRPLIGLFETGKMKDIKEIVKNQKSKQ